MLRKTSQGIIFNDIELNCYITIQCIYLCLYNILFNFNDEHSFIYVILIIRIHMLRTHSKCKHEVIVDLNIAGVKWRLRHFCLEVFMCGWTG